MESVQDTADLEQKMYYSIIIFSSALKIGENVKSEEVRKIWGKPWQINQLPQSL